jgi:hypothetical protein
MSAELEDPAKRDFDPLVDKVWAVEVEVRFEMYVTAKDLAEAEEVAGAYWHEEYSGGVHSEPEFWINQLKSAKHLGADEHSLPWGRCNYQGKELQIHHLLDLIANPPPPPPPPPPAFDEKTLLMPWVDTPPPYRQEEQQP